MTWVKINGKRYYMIELSSQNALLFTTKETVTALERAQKNLSNGERVTKVFGPEGYTVW